MTTKILHGDCVKEMNKLPDNSVDAIVTDPPYGLNFMGKKWDYDVPSIEMWAEALRVLKPGGFLLSFAGARTYHRMAVNIEDAGFEIRDQIQWLYGSGFPKSLNIGKQIDKIQGNERKDMGVSSAQRLNKHENDIYKAGIRARECRITKGDSEWEGWGTALKPANEPIVVARKPLSEKNVALNVLKWGTGGINIDACRVGTDVRINKGMSVKQPEGAGTFRDDNWIPKEVENIAQGRFPANIILDEEAGKMLDEQSGVSISRKGNPRGTFKKGMFANSKFNKVGAEHNDSGGASRFFYCAKASKSERSEGNNHPTVKPIKLMEYLVKLVSKENATVLDPFLGSGTTGIACKKLNRNFIGIEKDAEYIKIALARINAEQQKELGDVNG